MYVFGNMASWIISDQWYNNKRSNTDDEAKRIVETAAKLIKSDIRDNLNGLLIHFHLKMMHPKFVGSQTLCAIF